MRRLVTSLRGRPDDAKVELLDAAYWVKGCGSLGLWLLPQDLKLEAEHISELESRQVAHYLAAVVGKAHAEQMDRDTSARWLRQLESQPRNDKAGTQAPAWLWTTLIELIARHEQGYLEHCRNLPRG